MTPESFEARLSQLERDSEGSVYPAELLASVRALVGCPWVRRLPDSLTTCVGSLGYRVGAPELGRDLVQLDWAGHRCKLTVLVGTTRYQGRLQRQDSPAIRHYPAHRPEELLPALAYIEDSIVAASLGLTLVEWRAMVRL